MSVYPVLNRSMGQTTPMARPSGVIGKVDATEAARKIGGILQDAPECFEGEDLTLAKSLLDRLKEFLGSDRSLVGLSEADEKVFKRGMDCFIALERSKVEKASESKGKEKGFPILPVAIGAGVGGVLLLLLIATRK